MPKRPSSAVASGSSSSVPKSKVEVSKNHLDIGLSFDAAIAHNVSTPTPQSADSLTGNQQRSMSATFDVASWLALLILLQIKRIFVQDGAECFERQDTGF